MILLLCEPWCLFDRQMGLSLQRRMLSSFLMVFQQVGLVAHHSYETVIGIGP